MYIFFILVIGVYFHVEDGSLLFLRMLTFYSRKQLVTKNIGCSYRITAYYYLLGMQ